MRQFDQIEVIDVDGMISRQKIRIGFFQLKDFGLDRIQMSRRFTVNVIQLIEVGRQDRAFAINEEPT